MICFKFTKFKTQITSYILKHNLTSTGQALVEFATSSIIIILTISLLGTLLKYHWQKTQCAHEVFEATHAKLIGARLYVGPPNIIKVYEDTQKMIGEGWCGKIKEHVELQKLEATPW